VVFMSKVKRWLRVERDEAVQKDAGTVEQAFLSYVQELHEDIYGEDAGPYEPKSYSLSRLGETTKGVLWSVWDDWFGHVYMLDSGTGAEPFLYKSKDGATIRAREDVVEAFGEDLDSLGENTQAAVLKWAEGRIAAREEYRVVREDAAQRYTLGVAYPVDEIDSHGDFTDAAELEKAAWAFMRDVVANSDGAGVGTDHADGTDGAGVPVESYIYRGPEWVGENDELIAKDGDWLVGAVWSEDDWDRVKKGELTGWSIQGLAFRDDGAEEPEDGGGD
jgi:hypothetical protein